MLLREAAQSLATGEITSQELVEQCLDRIGDPDGQGNNVFVQVYSESALEQASLIDSARRAGISLPPFAGIPVTIKDLFDITGEITRAGSVALNDRPPATEDAEAVRRLKMAGFIPIGRTNMTEFAYTGLGVNPHYGTPLNPYERNRGRIPGGSSSGAAIAITDQMAFGSLGTDTGGSCRIPAALSGIVGLKSTASRVSQKGALPLSTSLDSIGPLAQSVDCCAAMDSVLSGDEYAVPEAFPVAGLRLAVPQSFVLDNMDHGVSESFERALGLLAARGAVIVDEPLEELLELPQINAKGGFAAAESYAWHRELIEQFGEAYDPRVLSRMLKGKAQSAADYIELLAARRSLIDRVGKVTAKYDALVYPTVPTIAALLTDLEDEEAYNTTNLLMLRNTAVANFLDRCAISIPCHEPGSAPVGLMLVGEHNQDKKLLSIAKGVESLMSGVSG